MKHLSITAAFVISLLFTNCGGKKNKPAENNNNNNNASINAEERNKQAVLKNLEGLNNHNVDMMLKDADPMGVDYGDGSTPPVKGTDSIKAVLTTYLNAFPDLKSSNPQLFAGGNTVVVVADYTGTFKNDAWGMKATGKTVRFKDADMFTFNEAGKIIEHRAIMPFSAILMMAGARMQ